MVLTKLNQIADKNGKSRIFFVSQTHIGDSVSVWERTSHFPKNLVTSDSISGSGLMHGAVGAKRIPVLTSHQMQDPIGLTLKTIPTLCKYFPPQIYVMTYD